MGLVAVNRWRTLLYGSALALAATGLGPPVACASAQPPQPDPRIEARSADLLAVGLVHDDRMVIHLSRVIDNAPIRDAVLTVLLRGTVHPTTAEPDGSYSLESQDLKLPGSATVVFQVAPAGAAPVELKGTIEVAAGAAKSEEPNSARQLGWWVLNFAVCIGFLMLLSRRRKAADARGD